MHYSCLPALFYFTKAKKVVHVKGGLIFVSLGEKVWEPVLHWVFGASGQLTRCLLHLTSFSPSLHKAEGTPQMASHNALLCPPGEPSLSASAIWKSWGERPSWNTWLMFFLLSRGLVSGSEVLTVVQWGMIDSGWPVVILKEAFVLVGSEISTERMVVGNRHWIKRTLSKGQL